MSIVGCFYEPEQGQIEFYLGEYRGLAGYETSTVIKIRYKGIETDIKERNYQTNPDKYQYYDMTNDHVMYDIKHRTYTKTVGIHTEITDEFYIINTNIIIRIIKLIDIHDEGMINIDLNGLSIMEFAFLNEQIYREAIRVFKKVFAEIQEQHLNSVNMANFTLPNVQGTIGTFLTGQNGSITEQRTMLQEQQEQIHAQEMREDLTQRRRRTSFYQNGGQHKSRKLYKLHKLYKSHKSRKSRKSRKSCKK
jgi:hypothetical protein